MLRREILDVLEGQAWGAWCGCSGGEPAEAGSASESAEGGQILGGEWRLDIGGQLAAVLVVVAAEGPVALQAQGDKVCVLVVGDDSLCGVDLDGEVQHGGLAVDQVVGRDQQLVRLESWEWP